MTLQTKTALATTISTNLADSTTGGISPSDHRTVENNLLDGIWQRVSVSINNTNSPYSVDLDLVQRIYANPTSGAITVTLPSSPSAGQCVAVFVSGTTNDVTVSGNGKNINGSSTNVLSGQNSWGYYEYQSTDDVWYAWLQ